MNKTKLTKLKKHKTKKYEEEEEESEGQDQYQPDGFLVPDDEVEEGAGEDVYNLENQNLPEAIIESDLASSDLDIMEDNEKKIHKKKLRKVDSIFSGILFTVV